MDRFTPNRCDSVKMLRSLYQTDSQHTQLAVHVKTQSVRAVTKVGMAPGREHPSRN